MRHRVAPLLLGCGLSDSCTVAESANPELIGLYERAGKLYQNHDFYVASTGSEKMFIYFAPGYYWRIGRTLGGGQVLAQTHYRAQDGWGLAKAGWKVWHEGRKTWLRSARMRLTCDGKVSGA